MKHKFWDIRTYRDFSNTKLVPFNAVVEETDIYFLAQKDLSEFAIEFIKKYRNCIESYILSHPDFLTSLSPLPQSNSDESCLPEIIKQMLHFSRVAGVGPMAGVAGAIAEFVGKEILNYSDEVIVENGGDVFLSVKSEKIVQLMTPANIPPIRFRIQPEKTPLGICTSSGTVGHSKSFGLADSVTVVSKSTILADCAATAICNLVNSPEDIKIGIEHSKEIKGVDGIIIVCGGKIGFFGDIEVV